MLLGNMSIETISLFNNMHSMQLNGKISLNDRIEKCTSPTSCLACAQGYLLEGTSCSTKCSSTYLTCKDNKDKCDSCRDQYVLSGTTRIECPTGCKTCEHEGDKSICRSCLDGYFKKGEK